VLPGACAETPGIKFLIHELSPGLRISITGYPHFQIDRIMNPDSIKVDDMLEIPAGNKFN